MGYTVPALDFEVKKVLCFNRESPKSQTCTRERNRMNQVLVKLTVETDQREIYNINKKVSWEAIQVTKSMITKQNTTKNVTLNETNLHSPVLVDQ
jgi:hypothetical protein